MTCIYDTRWIGENGIGRFARELSLRLPYKPLEITGRPMSPIDPLRLSQLRPGKFDWFLSPGYNAPLIASVPYVLTIHDLNHIDREENSNLFKKTYYRTILRRLVRRSRAVLTVSEYSRRRIIDWFGLSSEKVFNVGNGVSSAFSVKGEIYKCGHEYFLCVSNRRGHKNELGLLHAFAKTNLSNHPHLIFTGHATPTILKLARELGVEDRIAFCGNVSEETLAAMYHGALALIFPSFYEGFGLPIVEAFASGVPVITSNVTSMPEIAGDAALLVDPHNVAEIATAMEDIYKSGILRQRLVKRGQERAKYYTWDAVAKRVKSAVAAIDTDPMHPLAWS